MNQTGVQAVRRYLAGALAVMALIAGCGGTATTTEPSSPPAAPTGTFPVTITHALGATTIPAAPTRVVALSYEQDLLSQVGMQVVGHNENAVTPGAPYPWEEGKVDLAGSEVVVDAAQNVNLEAVAALAPDLILATNLSTIEQFYPQLSQIAPTVAYTAGWNKDSWQESATTVGTALGREADVATVVAGVEQHVAGIAAELPGLAGKTYASAYYYEPGRFVVPTDPDATIVRVYGQLGLEIDPTVSSSVQNRLLSAEQSGLLDVDYLQLSSAGPDLRSQLFADPLFSSLGVVRDGRYSETDESGGVAANYPTVLNIPWSLDQQVDVLRKVAAEAG